MDGTPFGRYRLIELLGRGGMGEVWRAFDTVTDRIVAVKVLPAHFGDNAEFQERFRREAFTASRLNTPHVVPIHTYGEIDGRLYVEMRLIEGRDLQSVLADGPLEPARAARIIEGIAKALHAAHKVGLVHRDVKPSNILLDEDDFPYLIDFGIARAAADTRLTNTGNMIGTFHYMAPERLGTREEDARADIYSLACVLYECLTGRPPFAGDSVERLIAAHLHTPPPQPSKAQPNLPAQVDKVIATGMAKNPDQRYATTVALANAARDAITIPIPRPAPTVPAQPPTQPASVPTAPAAVAFPQRTPPPRQVFPSAAPQQRPPVGVPTQRPPVSTRPARPWWRRKAVLISAAVAVIVVAIVVAVPLAITGNHRASQIAAPSQSAPSDTRQETLPFTGLSGPYGVAVDGAGTVYVADTANDRVVALLAGSSTQTVLPFTGLSGPCGVAVDGTGQVYVGDGANNRVVALPAGSTAQYVLPLTRLNAPNGVAVDGSFRVFVADAVNDRVVTLSNH